MSKEEGGQNTKAGTGKPDTGTSSGADDENRARLDKLNRELKAECERQRRKEKAWRRIDEISANFLGISRACCLIVLGGFVVWAVIDWVQPTLAADRPARAVAHLERPAGVAAAISFDQF